MSDHVFSVKALVLGTEVKLAVSGWRPIVGTGQRTLDVDAPDGVSWRFQLSFQPDAAGGAAAFGWEAVSEFQEGSGVATVFLNFPGVYNLHIDVTSSSDDISGHWLGQSRTVDRTVISALELAAAERLIVRDHGWRAPPVSDLKKLPSLDALADHLLEESVRLGDGFRSDFPCPTPQLLLASFAALRIGGLYEFGVADPSVPACVLSRPRVEWPQNCAEFLAAPTGCCLDLAAILAAVLDRYGIENRAVSILDEHVFNEACINGRWYALDPSIQAIYDRDYETIVKTGGNVDLWPLTLGGPGRPEMRHSQRALRHFLMLAPELRVPSEIRHHVPEVVFEDEYQILNIV